MGDRHSLDLLTGHSPQTIPMNVSRPPDDIPQSRWKYAVSLVICSCNTYSSHLYVYCAVIKLLSSEVRSIKLTDRSVRPCMRAYVPPFTMYRYFNETDHSRSSASTDKADDQG